nr:Chain R, TNEFYF PEPTIDE [synthetic construct]1W9E_S Chain S, TNEFYF PEPTIDE [synthetic construct]1W9E_T Chain T, TNEFYF PEPTIDE [synthetic construct]
TNEFYF